MLVSRVHSCGPVASRGIQNPKCGEYCDHPVHLTTDYSSCLIPMCRQFTALVLVISF